MCIWATICIRAENVHLLFHRGNQGTSLKQGTRCCKTQNSKIFHVKLAGFFWVLFSSQLPVGINCRAQSFYRHHRTFLTNFPTNPKIAISFPKCVNHRASRCTCATCVPFLPILLCLGKKIPRDWIQHFEWSYN